MIVMKTPGLKNFLRGSIPVMVSLALLGCLTRTDYPDPPAGEAPSAPLNVKIDTEIGRDTVYVSWDAPASQGSGPITGFTCHTVESVNGSELEAKTASGPCVLVAPFGVYLHVIVYAENKWSAKYGHKSPPSDTIAFRILRFSPTVPDVPRNLNGIVGRDSVKLNWSASDSDGGAPITSYTIVASPGGDSCIWTAGPLVCTIRGLSPETKYTFRIHATNSVGLSLFDSISVTTTNAWVARNSGTTKNLRAVTWSGTQLVAVGDSGIILTSPDGISWTQRSSGVNNRLNGVKWIGSRFFAVGTEGTILTSSDGVLWKLRTSGSTASLNDIAGSADRVVVVGGPNPGTSAAATLTSFDDSLWQSNTVTGGNTFTGILWTGTQFLTVAYQGYTAMSSDGLVWTSRGTSGGAYAAIGSGNGLYVAVGTRSISTSTDGTTWTARNTTLGSLNTVTWTGTRFYTMGSGGYAFASDNGIHWYQIPSLLSAYGSVWTGTKVVVVGGGGRVFTYP